MNVRDAPAIGQSVEYVRGLVRDEIAAGTPADRIVIDGFSQVSLFLLPSVPVLRTNCLLCASLCEQKAKAVLGVASSSSDSGSKVHLPHPVLLQGGHIALRTASSLQEPLAGAIGLSTWCEAPQQVPRAQHPLCAKHAASQLFAAVL